MGISNLIKEAALQYPEAKKGVYAGSRIGNVIRKDIPDELKKICELSDYKLKGSIGSGNFADIPWVSIMDSDLTKSTQFGIYIVFLFSSDGKRVYLSLNQGVTYFSQKKYNAQQIEQIISLIKAEFPSSDDTVSTLDLNATTPLGRRYSQTNIYAYKYETDNMPSDEIITANLDTLLTTYRQIKERIVKDGMTMEGFYQKFEQQLANVKYQEFKLLMSKFINQANLNLKNSENPLTTVGEAGFENNKFYNNGQFDRLIINDVQIDVLLFESGFYGPASTGEGSMKLPYICYERSKDNWVNLRVIFENYRAKSVRIVLWNKLVGYTETGCTFDIDNLSLFDETEPNETFINFYDNFFEKNWDSPELFSTLTVKEDESMSSQQGWNKILYGPPGTGKTYSIKAYQEELRLKQSVDNEVNDFFSLVTFHQSYGYEDFIEGIYAETIDGKINYRVKDGVFKEFCNLALKNPNEKFLFVIDEINRGNISKIFGELITLIEPTKRLGQAEALSVKLPYSGDLFGVPNNVYILGTMNTADRSIAMMDTALRRRFSFVEKMPDHGILSDKIGIVEGVDVGKMLEVMNKRIEYLYDRDHTLGHAFFMHVSTISDLKQVFENNIIPLLQEYFYEDYEKIKAVLNDTKNIYIEPALDYSNLFSDEFSQLVDDNDTTRHVLNKNVTNEAFEIFVKNIIKVGNEDG